MNPNYDMTKLRLGLDGAWKRLAELGEHKFGNEVEEALHILATQAHWIAKARPVLYHLSREINVNDIRLSSDIHEELQASDKLLDGWQPPPVTEVSFDGQNWIDLPYNKNVPTGMLSREKLKGGK